MNPPTGVNQNTSSIGQLARDYLSLSGGKVSNFLKVASYITIILPACAWILTKVYPVTRQAFPPANQEQAPKIDVPSRVAQVKTNNSFQEAEIKAKTPPATTEELYAAAEKALEKFKVSSFGGVREKEAYITIAYLESESKLTLSPEDKLKLILKVVQNNWRVFFKQNLEDFKFDNGQKAKLKEAAVIAFKEKVSSKPEKRKELNCEMLALVDKKKWYISYKREFLKQFDGIQDVPNDYKTLIIDIFEPLRMFRNELRNLKDGNDEDLNFKFFRPFINSLFKECERKNIKEQNPDLYKKIDDIFFPLDKLTKEIELDSEYEYVVYHEQINDWIAYCEEFIEQIQKVLPDEPAKKV